MSDPVTLQCPQEKWIGFLLETEGDAGHGAWANYPDSFCYTEQGKERQFNLEIHWVDAENNIRAVGKRKLSPYFRDRKRHFTQHQTADSTLEIRIKNTFFAYKKLGEKKK